MVALLAGRGQVLPIVDAAAVPRDNVVQSQFAGLLATVLAGETVPIEDLLAREAHLRSRPLDHVDETNDGRETENVSGAVEDIFAVFQDLGLAAVHQDERPSGVADVERLVVLVKNQYC
jgi:hypothetical protein